MAYNPALRLYLPLAPIKMDTASKEVKLRVSEAEFNAIIEILDNSDEYFRVEEINNCDYLILFKSLNDAIKVDEIIKDSLVYRGFDLHYKPNTFGTICENLIDKLHALIK